MLSDSVATPPETVETTGNVAAMAVDDTTGVNACPTRSRYPIVTNCAPSNSEMGAGFTAGLAHCWNVTGLAGAVEPANIDSRLLMSVAAATKLLRIGAEVS